MTIQAVADHYKIERALLAHPGGVSLAKLHSLTGIPKGTLKNHLETMEAHQRAEQCDTGWQPSTMWLAHWISGIAAQLAKPHQHK